MAVPGGKAVSYERGTPVSTCGSSNSEKPSRAKVLLPGHSSVDETLDEEPSGYPRILARFCARICEDIRRNNTMSPRYCLP